MEIVILKQPRRELQDAPRDIIEDVFALFDDPAADLIRERIRRIGL